MRQLLGDIITVTTLRRYRYNIIVSPGSLIPGTLSVRWKLFKETRCCYFVPPNGRLHYERFPGLLLQHDNLYTFFITLRTAVGIVLKNRDWKINVAQSNITIYLPASLRGIVLSIVTVHEKKKYLFSRYLDKQ